MAEKSIFFARAVVYYFDANSKSWAASPTGNDFCRVDMYENSGNGTYRVIARGITDTSKIAINSNVTKDTQYSRASDTFGKWADARLIYGLNFASQQEAATFGGGFENVVKKLQGGATTSAPAQTQAPQPQAPQPQAPAVQQAPKPATPPVAKPAPQAPAPKASAPPPAPSAPAPPPSAPAPPPGGAPPPPTGGLPPKASGGRADLLSSINSFNKGGLKKAVTVDKSGPLLDSKPSSSAPPSGGGGGGGARPPVGGGNDMMSAILAKRNNMLKAPGPGAPSNPNPGVMKQPPKPVSQPAPSGPPSVIKQAPKQAQPANLPPANKTPSSPSPSSGGGFSPEDLEALKQEILAEVRQELQQMKDEILAALQQSS